MLPAIAGEAIYCTTTSERYIALTFDDGPHPVYTRAIEQLLNEYQAEATFFVIGEHANQYSSIIASLVNSGHEVGNHTLSHPDLNLQLPVSIMNQIYQTDSILQDILGEGEFLFRPPYGHANLPVMYSLKAMNRKIIFWNIDLFDWTGKSSEDMFQIFEANIHPGSIVLLHDSSITDPVDRTNTVEVVEKILRKYTDLGYEFVTLSAMLNNSKEVSSSKFCSAT